MDEGAGTRTRLASERTQLAWWRTGLTAIAVALGVGRVVPELANSATRWPYMLIGLGFAIYGIALMAFGTSRAMELQRSIDSAQSSRRVDRALVVLTVTGMLLGLATGALIAVQ